MTTRIFLYSCLLAASTGLHSTAAGAAAQATDVFQQYSGFLNDTAVRRRRVVYTEQPVSPFLGVTDGFVHTTSGAAAFARTDLVVDAVLPIVVSRAYYSGGESPGHFGPAGWRLTLAETITARDNGFDYVYGNGTSVALTRDGIVADPRARLFSDIVSVRIEPGGTIQVRTRSGLEKRFVPAPGGYRLRSVHDAYANRLEMAYDEHDRLRSVSSSEGRFITLERLASGPIARIEDNHGRQIRYRYDSAGQLASVIDLRGEPWTYTYRNRRLTAAYAPNGPAELGFQYWADGRVRLASVNGVNRYYDYGPGWTTVTDDQGKRTRYAHHPSGLTQRVRNHLDVVTEIAFAADGLPVTLHRNGIPRLEFGYGAQGDLDRLLISDAVAGTRQLLFDRAGRVSAVVTPDPADSYTVSYHRRGSSPLRISRGDGTWSGVTLDERGELSSLRSAAGNLVHFRRSKAGDWQITQEGQRGTAVLRFDPTGRLEAAQSVAQGVMTYRYDPAGFRESSMAGDGGYSHYLYDAGGSLFATDTGFDDTGEESRYVYNFLRDRRVSRVVEDGVLEHLPGYDEGGRLATFESPLFDGTLGFGYDRFGRLERISRPGGRDAVYAYAAGEPDLLWQLDNRTRPTVNQQREVSSFGNRLDKHWARLVIADYGLLNLDARTGELGSLFDDPDWQPLSHIESTLAGLRLDALLEPSPGGMWAFSVPSNRLFVPPEIWAVNCCLCLPCTGSHFGGPGCYLP